MTVLEELSQAIISHNLKLACQKTEEALSGGISAEEVLNNGLLAGMTIVGDKFKNNEIYVPEVLVSARAMNAALDILKPKLAAAGVEPIGKVVIGSVKGDQHNIGKNLVAMMMSGAGIEVIDLGVDVSKEKFIQAVKDHKPDIVAMSALLTTTMSQQKAVIEALKEAGLRDSVKVMIGGAPVTEEFAKEIGADAYTKDASAAARVAREFIMEK